eukprot:15465565-Alexandrium_andersonii.AAC.1
MPTRQQPGQGPALPRARESGSASREKGMQRQLPGSEPPLEPARAQPGEGAGAVGAGAVPPAGAAASPAVPAAGP